MANYRLRIGHSNGRSLQAESGTYTLTGQDVTLSTTGVVDQTIVTSFQLSTGLAGTNTLPFTIGLGFKKGDIPSNISLDNLVNYQVINKRTWNDGSLKHAIVSGRGSLSSTPTTINVRRGVPNSGTALVAADIQAAAPTAIADLGVYGSYSLSSVLNSPIRTFISGHEMVECHYRAPVTGTQMAVFWHVRLYKDGRLWIRTIVENGYLDNGAGAAAPFTDYTYVPTITVGQAQVFAWTNRTITNITQNQRLDINSNGTVWEQVYTVANHGFPYGMSFVVTGVNGMTAVNNMYQTITATTANTLTNYAWTTGVSGLPAYTSGGTLQFAHASRTAWMTEGWVGANPQITPKHDVVYLRASGLVPNYGFNSPSSGTLDGADDPYCPTGTGPFDIYMPGTGFQEQIGLLPNWEARYFQTGDPRAWRALVNGASHLRSYAINHRVQANQSGVGTMRPAKPSVMSNWNPHGPGAGGIIALGAAQNTWENNHHPSGGYAAYLVTGDYWHYETMLFNTAMVYLVHDNSLGTGVNRLLRQQVRGTGWDLRTVGQCCGLAPAEDIGGTNLVEDYRTLLSNNYKSYTARVRDNTFSMAWSGSLNQYTYGGWGAEWGTTGGIASWMLDYWIQANGMISELDPLNDVQMQDIILVRDWMYRFIVGRLGRAGNAKDYGFHRAAPYGIHMATDNFGTIWYQDWGRVFLETTLASNTTVTNALEGSSSGQPSVMHRGYWGYLHPAIAYAVDHRAQGAISAYLRMTNASNWASNNSGFNNDPVFGILPRTNLTLPSWASAPALWTWVDVPGTNLSSTNGCVPVPAPPGNPSGRWSQYTGGCYDPYNDYFYMWAGGGHNVYAGNEVVKCGPMNSNTPSWSMPFQGTTNSNLMHNSPDGGVSANSAALYDDGLRSSTHNYNAVSFSRWNRKLIHAGYPGPFNVPGLAYTLGTYSPGVNYIASYNTISNTHDAVNTIPASGISGDFTHSYWVMFPATGDIQEARYQGNGIWKYNASTNTWTNQASVGTFGTSPGYGSQQIDPEYQQVIKIGGRSEQANPMRAIGWYSGTDVGSTFTGIDLKGEAYTGMVYDEANKNFLVCTGPTAAMTVWRITRTTAGANTFNIDTAPTTNTISGFTGNEGGLLGKFQYSPRLRGVFAWNLYTGNLKFMRTWDPGLGQ